MDFNLGDVGVAAPVREGAGLCLDDTADQISGLRGGDGSEAERVGSGRAGCLAAREGESTRKRLE